MTDASRRPVALVTGASRGIGAATAVALARQGHDVAGAPLGRWDEPHEVADAIAFLAGSTASYITGQTLVIDGGLSLSGH